MKKIFLATKNKKKIEEIKEILDSLKLEIELLSIEDNIKIPDVVEDRDTFQGNSEKKAVEIAKYLNMMAISDDSGLCVETLNGAPGVYSARYSGENATDEENNRKLIKEMKGKTNRKGKYVCVISLGFPTGEVYSFNGELEGEILEDGRGESGFGYDPHFYLPKYEKTLSEIPEIKSKISHRAEALRKMAEKISDIINKI